jgi:hypothetical protein
MNIFGWILILILIGVVFSAVGLNTASGVALSGAQLLVSFLVFLLIIGLILFAFVK